MSPTVRTVLFSLLGAALGGLAADAGGPFLPVLGLAVGALVALRSRDADRIQSLEARLRVLEGTQAARSVGDGPDVTVPSPSAIEVRPSPRSKPAVRPRRARRSWADAPPWAHRAWAFATGGNAVARVGLLVLFVGLGLLIRYAAEQGLLPIEARLAFAAAVGAVLLVIGWRLRDRSAAFALTLQGGGVAVLYLTVYAAYALYALVPSLAAIVLMALVAAGCAALAVLQGAPGLAVLGVAGGFAAPVLAGTEAGNHVLLLSYYALLNGGVLGIAWLKGWRSLAVVGFVSTFVTGGLWGGLAYQPDLYPTVQPFVILNFAIYLALAVRFAVRSVRGGAPPERALAVDGALVFGLPAATFVLQAALVEGVVPYGRAWSAVVLAAVYLVGAALAHRQRGLGLLGDAFLAVGLTFATLAAPLAFGRVVFGAMWVLEGAGLVWVGARQQKAWMRIGGLALQVVAATVLFVAGVLTPSRAFNAETLTGWIVALGLGLSAYVLRGGKAAGRSETLAGRTLLGFALFWWVTTAAVHVLDLVPSSYEVAGLLAAAVSAVLFLGLGRALAWRGLAAAALGLVPAAWALWISSIPGSGSPVGGLQGAAWALVFAVIVVALQAVPKGGGTVRRWAFVGAVWLAVAVVAEMSGWAAGQALGGGARALVGAVLAAGLAATLRIPEGVATAVERRGAALGLVAAGAVWLVLAAGASGGASLLPFVTPLNAASLALLVALAAAARSIPRTEAERSGLWSLVVGLGFVTLTAAVLRAVHRWAGTPWTAEALLASSTAQAALAVAWTLLALGLAVVAVRWRNRALWFFGAGVLALVVGKLFLVDLSQAAALVLIGAFIAVGAIVILIGYLAPLPPRQEETPGPDAAQ